MSLGLHQSWFRMRVGLSLGKVRRKFDPFEGNFKRYHGECTNHACCGTECVLRRLSGRCGATSMYWGLLQYSHAECESHACRGRADACCAPLGG